MKIANIVLLLTVFSVSTLAQSVSSPLLILIEQSVPKADAVWKVKESGHGKLGWIANSTTWTDGKDVVYSHVDAYSDATFARKIFQEESGLEKINGLGDEGGLDRKEAKSADPLYIVRFRKAGAIVAVTSRSEQASIRLAKSIAEAMPSGEAYSKLIPVQPSNGDYCHVYVVDVGKARKLSENLSTNTKTPSDVETDFPDFRTDIGEETLTTKTYSFPNSKLIITASVYYTDESMASKKGVDSMVIGVAVSDKALEDALVANDNAFAETTFYERDTIRVKKYLKVNGRQYLLGMQCNSNGQNDLP